MQVLPKSGRSCREGCLTLQSLQVFASTGNSKSPFLLETEIRGKEANSRERISKCQEELDYRIKEIKGQLFTTLFITHSNIPCVDHWKRDRSASDENR